MIEIHAERVRISPELASVNVQPECGQPQLGKIVRLTCKTDDDVRFEAVDLPRQYLRDDAERRMPCIILKGRLIQSGGEFA